MVVGVAGSIIVGEIVDSGDDYKFIIEEVIPFSQLLWVDSSFNILGNSSRADFLKCKTIYRD